MRRGRDPSQVELTHLSTTLIGADDRELAGLVERLRPRRQDPARYAAAVNAGTVDDQIGRFRQLAEAGVQEVVIRLPDLVDATPLDRAAKSSPPSADARLRHSSSSFTKVR